MDVSSLFLSFLIGTIAIYIGVVAASFIVRAAILILAAIWQAVSTAVWRADTAIGIWLLRRRRRGK